MITPEWRKHEKGHWVTSRKLQRHDDLLAPLGVEQQEDMENEMRDGRED